MSRSSRPRAWGRHQGLLLPSAHLIPRGWAFAQLDQIFPRFQNLTAQVLKRQSLETRLCLGSRREGRKATGPQGEDWPGKGSSPPASEPVIAEWLLRVRCRPLGLPPLSCLLCIRSSVLGAAFSWKISGQSMTACGGGAGAPESGPAEGTKPIPRPRPPTGAGEGFCGLLQSGDSEVTPREGGCGLGLLLGKTQQEPDLRTCARCFSSGLSCQYKRALTLPAPLPKFAVPVPLPSPSVQLSSLPTPYTFFSSCHPCFPRLARGLPSCCGVACGRGLRPRCRVGEEGRARVPAFRMGLPRHHTRLSRATSVGCGFTQPHLTFLLWTVPQRTSPTGPKNMQTSGRLSNVAPPCILRKNPPSARNGGHETDAQILELNQQVSGVQRAAEKARPVGRQGGKGG